MSTERDDTTRIEGFSDAIFGFGATLLVVSLEVPKDFAALTASLKGFISFGISFAVLVGLWTIHRAFFRRYQVGDLPIVALNTVLLFLVLFYIYPLKFLSRAFVAWVLGPGFAGEGSFSITPENLRQMFAIYGAGWAAVFVCFALMYLHIWRRRIALALPDDASILALDYFGHYLVFAMVGLLSTAVAMIGVGIQYGSPGMAFFLIGPVLTIYWRWRTKGRAPAAVAAAG